MERAKAKGRSLLATPFFLTLNFSIAFCKGNCDILCRNLFGFFAITYTELLLFALLTKVFHRRDREPV